jgi:tetratricopeptide (TPR) repeat protein
MSNNVVKYNQAEKLKDQGKSDDAIKLLQEILGEDPNHVLSHLTLARIFTQIGRHLEAIEHGRKACEIEPTDAFNFTALSVTYQKAWAGTGERQFIGLAEEAMAQARVLER